MPVKTVRKRALRPRRRRRSAEGATSILSRVGNTPLLRLERIGRTLPRARFYAKAEWFNPGGSIKDRAALAMIRDGEISGRLTPDRIILDATSGNTGISYALIGAALGYRVRLTMPGNASDERKKILAAYGVDIVYTDPADGSDGAIREAREMYAAEPGRYFYPDQYGNPANWRAHYDGTALEIWEQTGGRVTHFVAALGSSGTFVGVARRLKELDPRIRCVSIQPDGPFHGLEGMKHMESSIVPAIYDPRVADDDFGVRTEDAYRMVRRLVREEGLFVGISSGAAMAACLRLAEEIPVGREAEIVTIFPDSGEKYLTERFWDEFDTEAGTDDDPGRDRALGERDARIGPDPGDRR